MSIYAGFAEFVRKTSTAPLAAVGLDARFRGRLAGRQILLHLFLQVRKFCRGLAGSVAGFGHGIVSWGGEGRGADFCLALPER